MGQWVRVVLPLVAGVLCVSTARADETAKKIQSAVKKIESSVVAVRYSRDMEGIGGDFQGRGGRGFARAFGGPRITSGIVTNDKGFVAIPAGVTRDPTRGWMPRGRGSSGGELKDLTVILAGGEERKAKLAGRDSTRNLAFVLVEDPSGLNPVSLSTAKSVSLAEQVIVIAPLSDQQAGTRRFLLTRINAVVEGDSPYYSAMDDLGPYDGGIVANLDGDVIGIVARPPAPRTEGDEDDEMISMARRFMGGRARGLAIVPSASIQEIFAEPPTGLLPREGEEEGAKKEGDEGEKKDEEKGKEKPDEDY